MGPHLKTATLICLGAIVGPVALAAPPAVLTAAVEFPGASATEVDAQVASPLAVALSAVEGARRLEITSVAGRCSAVMRFDANVEPAAASASVRDCLNRAMTTLPAKCPPPLVRRGDPQELPRLWVSITGEGHGLIQLSEIAQSLSDQLARTLGETEVRIFGAAQRTPTLRLDAAKLAACGLTAAEVQRALADHPPATAEELKNVVIAVRNTIPVRATDVGRVDQEVRGSAFATVDERPAVLVGIATPPAEATAAAVQEELDRLRKILPQGARVELVADLKRGHFWLLEATPEPDSSNELARRTAGQIMGALRAAGHANCIGFSSGDAGPFQVFVPAGDQPDGDADLRKRLAVIPHVTVRVSAAGDHPPFPVRVTLSGPDRNVLHQWAQAVVAGVSAEGTVLDPDLFPPADQPRLKFEIDPDAAKRLALSSREIMEAVRLASGNAAALRLAGGQAITVRLEAPRGPAELLSALTVRNANGDLVPLGAVANATAAYEPPALLRLGTSPAVRLTGAPPAGGTPAAAAATVLRVAAAERETLKLPADYQAADVSETADKPSN